MTYAHVFLVCKDCQEKLYLYEPNKPYKTDLPKLMESLELFRQKHSGHVIDILDYDSQRYEDHFYSPKELEPDV